MRHQPLTTRSLVSITDHGQGIAPPNSPQAMEICREVYRRLWAKPDRLAEAGQDKIGGLPMTTTYAVHTTPGGTGLIDLSDVRTEEESAVNMRDERGFWAWVADCVFEAAADGEILVPVAVAAGLRSTWPLLMEETREGYRMMADGYVWDGEGWTHG